MNILDIIDNIKIKTIYGTLPENVNTISQDSRNIGEGDVFIAIKGYTVDGHNYIEKVIKQGASLVIASRYEDYPTDTCAVVVVKETEIEKIASIIANRLNVGEKVHTVAVTGTNGKTSISTLIHNMLRLFRETSAYLGTNGFCKNDEIPAYLGNTTPDVVTLHNKIGEVRKQHIKNFAFEASSHAMVLGRIYNVDIDIAIFTNLTHEHLDFHGDMQTYAYDKSLLFSTLGNNLNEAKFGVLNKDDDYYNIMAKCLYHQEITYSLKDKTADFFAYNITQYKENGVYKTGFTLKSPEGEFKCVMNYIGDFMVSNVLAAMIAVWLKGKRVENIVEILPKLSPLYGRMEILGDNLPIDIISDFAHTPDGYKKLLEATRDIRRGKRTLLVTGMGGGRDISKGPLIGEIISEADYVVITTDSPRDEDVEVLMSSIEKGMTHKNYEKIWFRTDAVKRVIELANPGDVVILASKGREDYEILKDGKKVWHSDPIVALEEAEKKFNGRVKKG
ncbi:UDP-N-acetylmuramoyl-L-alanyl-D-glutamate--2,6-diaminopimelate ligase [Gemella bergeri ATCC 700627]|uniref:UDP-N-acetylmuramyl-tripeptide synthetase n=1 Tax=Gemella bergeri ATCC 700627 TaxID=1321820 RepID=U2S1A1_9BACL|nr:UDP-N-acetylmuramoyl-L-alanyl-D-glutamate--2,6-diaminopimelate ligase [Gemella bergeri]ERK59508.1 UDP-N-acetylmuramoyl-L-alanyl-D-glutamate--2,6-diaminopimelate ligase [Gemella bergeri ATCC 700627]